MDFYEENSASHSWPDDVGVSMRLLSAAQWREAFEDARLEVIEQSRITLPAEQVSESWKVDVGSLMTAGQRGRKRGQRGRKRGQRGPRGRRGQ